MRDSLKFIFDNSALVAIVEKLKLHNEIKQLKGQIELIIPSTVFKEFCVKASKENEEFVKTNFKILNLEPDQTLTRFLETESGEVLVISQGMKYQANKEKYFCVIDEKAARDVAELFELQKTGTIGVLRTMYEMKIISMDKLKTIKLILLNSDFRIKPEHLSWIK